MIIIPLKRCLFISAVGLLFFCASFVSAQTGIKGTAPSFAGKEIRLYTYRDYITRSKVMLESTLISGDGSFAINLPENVNPTFYGIFKIENFAAVMFIEPDTDYEISIVKPDSVSYPEDRIHYIEINILHPVRNNLNLLINNFDEKYNHFVRKNYALFLQKSAKAEVDSFKAGILKQYDKNENTFFKSYVKYYLASLDLIATANRQKVYSEYLASSPVEYENLSYMMFFGEFYNKQFDSFSEPHIRDLLLSAVNVQKSYEKAMEVLSKEKLLGNEKIRELVLMDELYDNYNNAEFDKKSIHLVLKEMVKKSAVPEHREIAMNILSETGRIGVGSQAPEFTLYDSDQKPVRLSDFRGKYVYLDFWATWCIPCIKEMPLMSELKKKYGKDIIFVSISIDNDLKAMKKFLARKKEYDWVFLHYGNFPEVKELYNVLAIPLYYLVDPEGVIVQSPAYRPSGKIEDTFINISSGKKTKRKSYEWDW